MRKASFSRTKRRIASPGIEPGVSNLTITSPMLYQLRYRHRFVIADFVNEFAVAPL